MLMLSLNYKYFIRSVYAGMLWSLGDTEPFHVNFFDVLQKNLYRLPLCGLLRAGGAGQEQDQIRYISAGAGGHGTESCESGTEKSVPRRSLGELVHVS